MDTNYTFELVTVATKKTAIHPLLELSGYNSQPDEFIKRDFDYFNHYYDKPVVVYENDKYLILNHATDYHSWIDAGHDYIDVYVSNFTNEFDIRRYIGFRNGNLKLNWNAAYDTITFLDKYRETEDGKELFETIAGTDYADKIGVLMGTSGSKIGRIKDVGDYAPEFLPMITNREQTFQNANNIVLKRKAEEKAAKKAREKAEQEAKERESNPEPVIQPKIKESPYSLHDFFKGLMENGCIKLEFDNENPILTLNNTEFESMSIQNIENAVNDETVRIVMKDSATKGLQATLILKMIPLNMVMELPKAEDGNTIEMHPDQIKDAA
jgi:hypothetical protein